ncbi:hypothetical protein NLX83_07805 [Allokutzneria sp. A3M-2-11 16]|uniref:AMIN-like domain-containing (lipo)protein n=1 Tax=Allokutzneria sp. A3M-2-11 16 TaxID=2962043 RepID=UPI0020B84317|nr:hypothetical protein [Allokutzneria sp. A3M-2-11 16]MCP3799157.1 hypothetical protein [Allokutzneria sp. A3M-2-11 16]
MTSLLSRLAVGGVLIAALGGAVAPIANAAPAPAAVKCSDGNVLKDAFVSADHDGIGVYFNHHCKVAVQEITYLNPGEKPSQEGSGDAIAVKGKAFVRVIINDYNVGGDSYSGPKRIQGEGAVKEIVHGGYHAGQSTWYIGVDKKRAFTKTVEGKTVSLYFNLV